MTEISEVKNIEGLCYLESISDNSINLVLTDPPYITSRKTGMDEQSKIVKRFKDTNKNLKSDEDWNKLKTDDEWEQWMTNNNIVEETDKEKELSRLKSNYLKYGSLYGKKYAVVTDYGEWDKNFTMEMLEQFTHAVRSPPCLVSERCSQNKSGSE